MKKLSQRTPVHHASEILSQIKVPGLSFKKARYTATGLEALFSYEDGLDYRVTIDPLYGSREQTEEEEAVKLEREFRKAQQAPAVPKPTTPCPAGQNWVWDGAAKSWICKSKTAGSFDKIAMIKKTPGKREWCVIAESGRNMGCYSSRKKAKERLRQIEMFKHMKGGSVKLSSRDYFAQNWRLIQDIAKELGECVAEHPEKLQEYHKKFQSIKNQIMSNPRRLHTREEYIA